MEFRVTSKHKLTYLDAECNTLFECRFINVLENRYIMRIMLLETCLFCSNTTVSIVITVVLFQILPRTET